MDTSVRTRFAPSPTGLIHVGGIRTAVFAWLIARQNNGAFVLRLEDTDKNREVAGGGEHIMQSLKVLGITYDEGPDIGGPYAPYKQSERLAIYTKWAQMLIDEGRAYADPYSAAEVQEFRVAAQKAKQPFLYRNHRPQNPPTWDGKQPLRFKSDPKSYQWHDEVMGDLSTGAEVIDDFILIKSDGYPTYNFAHIIDDAEMKITHVMRGQEFLASTPNYLNLYEALGIDRPVLATMPHIMSGEGNKKLSKRDGAKDVLDYVADGYLPEALINQIATLGWNDGTEQEIFSIPELISKFSLNRVQRSGALFDERRLRWINGSHIRALSQDALYEKVQHFWPQSASNFGEEYKKQVLGLVQERLKFFSELPQLTNFFFEDLPINLDLITSNKQLKKLELLDIKELLTISLDSFESLGEWTATNIQTTLNQLLEQTGQKPGVLFSVIRIATTQAPASPGLPESMALLGKERSLAGIKSQIAAL